MFVWMAPDDGIGAPPETSSTGLRCHDVSLRLPWASLGLAATCVIVFAANRSGIDANMTLAVRRLGANAGEVLARGERRDTAQLGGNLFTSGDRPQISNLAYRFAKLSPRRDPAGFLDGRRDRPNSIAVDGDVLQVCGAYVSDNGEGDAWPHGPVGHIYIDFFASTEPLAASADGADQRRLGRSSRLLRGPHRTHGDLDEWLDDEFQRYEHFGVFQWSGRDAVVARIWESDGSEDGRWGRRNDVLGMELVNRADTLQGTWIPLHAYTNHHPRRRTSRITGWLLVKTGGTCPPETEESGAVVPGRLADRRR